MDRVSIKRFGCAILVFLTLFLCSCGKAPQDEQMQAKAQAEMDALLVKIMTYVENNDMDGACALAYGPEQMKNIFPALVSYWPARSTDPFEASGLNIRSEPDQGRTTYDAVYLIKTGGKDYQIKMGWFRDQNGEGLTSLTSVRIKDLIDSNIMPEAFGRPAAGEPVRQWTFTCIWILSCLLCVWTVVHIILKKPKRYLLWLLLALPFIGAYVFSHPDGFLVRFRFGLFRGSYWSQYESGANVFQLCLPLGAIVYWIVYLHRLRMIRKMNRSFVRGSDHGRHRSSHRRHSGSSHHSRSGSSHHRHSSSTEHRSSHSTK